MTWYGGYFKRQDNKKIKDILYIVTVHHVQLMPRGSIVLALWIRWASRAFLKESGPFLSFSKGIKSMIVGMITG